MKHLQATDGVTNSLSLLYRRCGAGADCSPKVFQISGFPLKHLSSKTADCPCPSTGKLSANDKDRVRVE